MARRSRVVLNRAALDEVMGGLADGVFDMVRAIGTVAEANVPYGTEKYGHLEDRIGAAVWVQGRKTHEWSSRGETVDKPREVRVRTAGTYVGLVGAGFPGMFVELGTVNAPAQPFLTPAANEIIPEAQVRLSNAMARRLRGERSDKTAMIRERVAASRAARSGGA